MADNFDDGMTDAERHFFSTGGDVNDDLAREHSVPAGGPLGGQQEPPPAPVTHETQHELPADPGRAPPQEEDPGDEIIPGQPNPRRVSYRKYQGLEQQLQEERRQRQEDAVRQARIEERLSLLQQAVQPDPAAAAQPDPANERPDPAQDIFAYTAWLERQLTDVSGKVNNYESQIETGQREMNEERQYVNSLNSHAASDPHFMQSYNFLLRSRAAELMASEYPNATYEQLMQAQIPDRIGQILVSEERDLYKNAFAGNRNPAADIVRMAQLRGWRAPVAPVPGGNGAAAPVPGANGAAASAQQPPGTPLAAAPAAAVRPSNGAVAPQPANGNGAAPTATDLVEQIRRGQAAATSLSNGSGSAANQLTPETLANMSDADFEAIFNELQASGNKTRLQELMGR